MCVSPFELVHLVHGRIGVERSHLGIRVSKYKHVFHCMLYTHKPTRKTKLKSCNTKIHRVHPHRNVISPLYEPSLPNKNKKCRFTQSVVMGTTK